MIPEAGIFLRIDGEVRGPCSFAAIRRLADNAVVARDTEASVSPEGPWVRLETFPEADRFLPVRREFRFKPVEAPATEAGAAPLEDIREVIALTRVEGPVLRRDPPREPNPPVATPAESSPNEIEAMVREVREREARSAPPPPPPRRRRIQARLKIVGVLAVVANAGLLAVPTFYGAWGDSWSLLVFKAWALILNGGLVILYLTLPNE